ncbi:MAG: hypothetical protein ABIH83_05080 [Candidatus Micrarchaeota archaeon]
MDLGIWDDDVAKTMDRVGHGKRALVWKISNLFGKINILAIMFALIFIVITAIYYFVVGGGGMIFDILLGIALIGIISTVFTFGIYSLCMLAFAIIQKEYLWAAGIFFVAVLAVPYKHFKGKEIEERGYAEKEDNVGEYFEGKRKKKEK